MSDPVNIPTDPFTHEELLVAIKPLKNKKTPGPDNIPALIRKDPIFHDLIQSICNHTLPELSPPSSWRISGVTPVHKKGDLTNPSNYHDSSLTLIAAKIYNRLILNRLLPAVDPLLRKTQNGFSKGQSIIAQILCFRRTIEEMRNHNK